jgi:hypothetical protein
VKITKKLIIILLNLINNNQKMESNIDKEKLCSKIKEIYHTSCVEKREMSKPGYFYSANVEINKISNDLQNFCCINAMNSMLKYCVVK